MTLKLTNRQVEALAQLAIGRPLKARLDGSVDYRASAAHSGLLGRLEELDLITPRGRRGACKLTFEGLDALEENKHRLPRVDDNRVGLPFAEVLPERMAARRAELNAEEAEERRQLDKRRARAAERAAETERRIPERLRELAFEHCGPTACRALDAYPADALVAFWRAVVNADAAL